MKYLLQTIFIIFIFSLSIAQAQLKSAGEILNNIDSQIVKITVDELVEKTEAQHTIILLDVRTEKEYLAGHIANSVWIPRGFLEFRIQKITSDPEEEIVIYCKGGGRSALAVYTLLQMGYSNVFNLEGGLKEWVISGNSVYNVLGELSVIGFEKLETY